MTCVTTISSQNRVSVYYLLFLVNSSMFFDYFATAKVFCDNVFKLCGVDGNRNSLFRNEGKDVKQQNFFTANNK